MSLSYKESDSKKYWHFSALLFIVVLFSCGCAGPTVSYEDYVDFEITQPQQETLDSYPLINLKRGNREFNLIPQAKYSVAAVVRSKKRYFFDKMAAVSPYDFALVWGFLADEHFYKQLRINQARRRYLFSPKRGSDLSVAWVYLNSSNHHLIPANKNIQRALRRIRKNDRIILEGYLVNVRQGNYRWNTSMTRNDRGDGSCEILYVTKVKRNYLVYE